MHLLQCSGGLASTLASGKEEIMTNTSTILLTVLESGSVDEIEIVTLIMPGDQYLTTKKLHLEMLFCKY